MEQQILIENDAHLDVHTTEQPLVSITEQIQTEIVALSVEQDVKVIQEESAVLLVLTEGGSLYKKAVQDGYSGTELEWMTELLDSKASVQFVTTTIADSNNAYALALLALKAEVGDTYATNTHLSEVIATRDLARAIDKQNLESKIASDIFASNQTMLETLVTSEQALSQSINTLTTQLGSFGSKVSAVETAISTETTARALAIQTLNSNLNGRIDSEIVTINQTFVDATQSFASQVLNVETSFNNLLGSSINTVNASISNESSSRASQINTLRADFTSGISAVLTNINEVRVDVQGNTQALTQVSGKVNDPVTGLTAAFNRANSAYTLADGTAGSLSTISGKVNHATTGLEATYNLTQEILIDYPKDIQTAKTEISNEITDPTAGWIANNEIIQSIKGTADGAAGSITTINTSITDLNTWKTNTATVELKANKDALGVLQARAFIGVTSAVDGIATIAGLTIDTVDYSLRFQGDIFELVNTAGQQQLYYDTADSVWKFAGSLVAASFKTATSGYRVEMDGTSAFPLWYGQGTKNSSNALFSLDNAGNIKLNNVQLTGGLITNSTGQRGEYKDDGTYLIWLGDGTKNDTNGTFWVKKNGTGFIKGNFFQGEIIETKFATYSDTANEAALATILNHSSAGKTIEITGSGNTRARATGGDYSSVILEATGTLYRSGNVVGSTVVQTKGVYNLDLNRTEWFINYPIVGFSTGHGVGTQTAQYQVTFAIIGSTPNFSYITKNCSVKTFENKLE